LDISKELNAAEHGTHVSGLTVLGGLHDGRTDFGEEIGLLPIRTFPLAADFKEATDDAEANMALEFIRVLAESMALAHAGGAAIINMSLGTNLLEVPEKYRQMIETEAHERIIARLRGEWKGLLVVAAA